MNEHSIMAKLDEVLKWQVTTQLKLSRLERLSQAGIEHAPGFERATTIKRLTGWDKDGNDLYTLREFQNKYHVRIDGTNYYYSVAQGNANAFRTSGRALNPWHRAYFGDAIDTLRRTNLPEYTVVLGLEPSESAADLRTFDFMEENLDLVEQLARELQEYISEASALNKMLHIIVRYASEMNTSNVYSGQPRDYLRALPLVRKAFWENAPDVQFAFSPNVIFNHGPDSYGPYWPRDTKLFDVISCTWYVGEPAHLASATKNMRAHLRWAAAKGKPLGVDELGGGETRSQPRVGRNNDEYLEIMLSELLSSGYHFEYVTIFLEKWWGTDADLSFIPRLFPDRVVQLVRRDEPLEREEIC